MRARHPSPTQREGERRGREISIAKK